MILLFENTETAKIWAGERGRKLPDEIQEMSRRKLRMLHNYHAQ